MYRSGIKGCLFLAVVFILSACSTQQIEDDIIKLKSGIKDLRSVQAEQTAKIASLEADLRAVSGNVEEVRYATDQKLGQSIESLQGDVSMLRKRVPPPSIVPEEEFGEDERGLSALPEELAVPVEKGFQGLREADFTKSLAYWDESLDLAIGTDWEAFVRYWRTITLEGLSKFPEAIQEYATIVKKYPKSPKAPLALYRHGSLLIKLGDKKIAKLAFSKLISDYPKNPKASLAKEQLKGL